jgi:hypothetical protein
MRVQGVSTVPSMGINYTSGCVIQVGSFYLNQIFLII